MSKYTMSDTIGHISPAIPVRIAGLFLLLIVGLVGLVGIAFIAGQHAAAQSHPRPTPLTKTSAPEFDHACDCSATSSKPVE